MATKTVNKNAKLKTVAVEEEVTLTPAVEQEESAVEIPMITADDFIQKEPTAEVESIILTPTENEDTASAETKPAEAEVTFTAEVPKVERKVRICMAVTHSCTIGGEAYHLEKGKQYNVPENVKRILLKAGLLQPLD